MGTFTHPLGLSKTEWNVLRGALHARTLVPNGHFLAGTTKAIDNACKSLAKRGYVRRVSHGTAKFSPFDSAPWPIVKVTKGTIDRYNKDIAKLREATA